MDDIKEQLNSNMQQIEIMENFIALSLRREGIAPDIPALTEDTEQVRKLMLSAYQKLHDELESLEEEYGQLMRRMRQQQSVVLDYVLKQKKQKRQEEKALEDMQRQVLESACMVGSAKKSLMPSSACKAIASSGCKALTENRSKLTVNNGCFTPKMTIYDYKESPLVQRTRINPIPLSFLEFDVQVTSQLFETIPKYMKGRETVGELNEFLESIIIPCFNHKYQLLHRQRSTVRNRNDLELWKLFNEQASYLPGKYFITAGDISRKLNKMLDKKLQNRITMLRHIGILQEQRVSQTVCYIWSVK